MTTEWLTLSPTTVSAGRLTGKPQPALRREPVSTSGRDWPGPHSMWVTEAGWDCGSPGSYQGWLLNSILRPCLVQWPVFLLSALYMAVVAHDQAPQACSWWLWDLLSRLLGMTLIPPLQPLCQLQASGSTPRPLLPAVWRHSELLPLLAGSGLCQRLFKVTFHKLISTLWQW